VRVVEQFMLNLELEVAVVWVVEEDLHDFGDLVALHLVHDVAQVLVEGPRQRSLLLYQFFVDLEFQQVEQDALPCVLVQPGQSFNRGYHLVLDDHLQFHVQILYLFLLDVLALQIVY